MIWITHSSQFSLVHHQDKGIFFFDTTLLLEKFLQWLPYWTCLEVYCLSPALTVSIVSRKGLVSIRCTNRLLARKAWKCLSFALCSTYYYRFSSFDENCSSDACIPSKELLELLDAIYPGLLAISPSFLNIESRERLVLLLWDFVFLVSEETNKRIMDAHFPNYSPLKWRDVPKLVDNTVNDQRSTDSLVLRLLLSDPLVNMDKCDRDTIKQT